MKVWFSAVSYLLRFPILPYCQCDPQLRSDVIANIRENLETLKIVCGFHNWSCLVYIWKSTRGNKGFTKKISFSESLGKNRKIYKIILKFLLAMKSVVEQNQFLWCITQCNTKFTSQTFHIIIYQSTHAGFKSARHIFVLWRHSFSSHSAYMFFAVKACNIYCRCNILTTPDKKYTIYVRTLILLSKMTSQVCKSFKNVTTSKCSHVFKK